jgi:hypothetical protein
MLEYAGGGKCIHVGVLVVVVVLPLLFVLVVLAYLWKVLTYFTGSKVLAYWYKSNKSTNTDT